MFFVNYFTRITYYTIYLFFFLKPHLNANHASLTKFSSVKFEPSIQDLLDGEVVQFERLGYFCKDDTEANLFHRTVGLRDEWANIQKRKGTN